MTLAGIYAIASLGLNLLVGYTGQISFGHNAFAALGGYASAILTTRYAWGAVTAALAGIAMAVAAAAAVGYPTLRLRGHYLAMGTLALGLVTDLLAVQLEWLTMGFVGIAAIPPLALGPFAVETPRGYYAVAWSAAALVLGGVARVMTSRVGRALRAVRENEDAARALGVDATAYKVLAFTLSAACAALAGSLYAHFVSYVSPEAYGIYMVVLLFTMLFLGGVGSSLGPVLGALVVAFLPELLSGLKGYRELVYGCVLLAVLMVAPRGLYAAVLGRRRA
jgi:branched-chain amino acid transport system permease protein